MPNSEKSFIDRAQKAHALLAAITGFAPAFTPMDNSLTPVHFESFLSAVDYSNIEVGNTKTAFSNAVTARKAASAGAVKLTTQVVNFVQSNSGWKLKFPRIKELADKVRAIHPPRNTPPPPAPLPGLPPPPPGKPRDRGDGSYAEIAINFRLMVTAVGVLSGYSAPGTDIDLPALTALAAQLESNNLIVGTADSQLDNAQRARNAVFFYPETGLADKFQTIKKAVKGLYGQSSTQYAQVKGMRW